MTLVDTSVWIDHFRQHETALAAALDMGDVAVHPLVIGELACGHLKQRATVLGLLSDLPMLPVASDDEVLHFIDHTRLFGRGIGFIDAHLLASVHLSPGALLWTRDRRLRDVARHQGVASATT